MKTKLFITILIAFSIVLPVAAQDKKEKKKKKKEQPPALAIVEVQQAPPPMPVVEAAKPHNGSLFTDNSVNGNLLRDFKARQVGDLIFVDVVETSTATVTSSAARKRDSGNLGGIVPLLGAIPVGGVQAAAPVVGEMGKRKFEGNGNTERESNVRARITARVIAVLPNGDMRIEAVKMVKINKETEQLAVTGIVRPNDLGSDNSVQTILVGDLRVEFNGKGIASADNAPGWLFRLFDKISPF